MIYIQFDGHRILIDRVLGINDIGDTSKNNPYQAIVLWKSSDHGTMFEEKLKQHPELLKVED